MGDIDLAAGRDGERAGAAGRAAADREAEAADRPGRARPAYRGARPAEAGSGVDFRAALTGEAAAVADGECAGGEDADSGEVRDAHRRAVAGNVHGAADQQVGLGDVELAAVDHRQRTTQYRHALVRAGHGERAAVDGEAAGEAVAQGEIAAQRADVATVAGARERQHCRGIVELELAGATEAARERAAGAAGDEERRGRIDGADLDGAAAGEAVTQRTNGDVRPVAQG